jgi:NitT/TauT family transport system substrate-binding protein
MERRCSWTIALAGAMLLLASAASAQAETKEIRIAQQFGLSYLPLHVAIDQGLIDKRLKDAGLGETKVTLARLGSGAAVNEALIAGEIDVAMGGATVLMTIWDKTRGRGNIRGMMAICDSPIVFNTTDPKVRTLRDMPDGEKIAMTAVKVTHHAVVLQMAAAKEFGWENRFKLDPLTVSMPHPEAMAAILSGRLEVKTHAATIPFLFQELEDSRVRSVLNSYDVAGGRHTLIVAFNTEKWKNENPKAYAAVAQGIEDAMAWIGKDKRAAAELYVRFEKSKLAVEKVEAMLRDENMAFFSATPSRMMLFAEFMHKNGSLSTLPASWEGFFHDNMRGRSGS